MVFSQYHTCTICVVDNEHGDDCCYSSHCISVLCYFFVWCFCLSSANFFLLFSPHVWLESQLLYCQFILWFLLSLTLILSMKSLILYEDEYTLFLKHLWNTISELGLPLVLGAVSCSLLCVIRRRLKWQFTHIQHYDRVWSYQQKTCCFITILLSFPILIPCVLCGRYVGAYVGLSMSLAMMLAFTGTS
jgi:hypothetical protein